MAANVTRGGDWGVIAQVHACGCGCGPFGPHQGFDGVAVCETQSCGDKRETRHIPGTCLQ